MSVIRRMASTIAEECLQFTRMSQEHVNPVVTAPTVAVRRPQRADARRNFDALLAAARDVFAEQGADASLEEIARRAGVGIGTLYRNFPTRLDLFDAVYVGEVEELCGAARGMGRLEPWEAFAAWVDRFAGYVATKMAIMEGAQQGLDDAARLQGRDGLRQRAALPARPGGRRDPRRRRFDDVLRMLAGIAAATYVGDEQRDHVLGMALDGIRARPSA